MMTVIAELGVPVSLDPARNARHVHFCPLYWAKC